jgi:hypothetical protein
VPAANVVVELLESRSSQRVIGAIRVNGSSMTEGKLGLHVYELALLVVAKPSERNDHHGSIRIEDDYARIQAAVSRFEAQSGRWASNIT